MKLTYALSICFIVAIYTHGQTSTSAFESKVDKWLKLYTANFELITEDQKQVEIIDGMKTSWKKAAILKSKATIQDKNGITTNLNLRLKFYKFDDDSSCVAAKDSLLNCFGEECVKIQWGAVDQKAKINPCIYIFNTNEIISCQVSCEQKNNYWTLFVPDLEKTFAGQGAKILEADCDGPVSFREK